MLHALSRRYPVLSAGPARAAVAGLLLILAGPACLAAEATGDAAVAPAAEDELRFPGEETNNKLVYHFNKGDEGYQLAVLNTIRNMLSIL